MSGERNFQQIWDFRRRDDDIDSSSDDSKSSSKGEPKHELASVLNLAGNDETSDDPRYQKTDQVEPGEGAQLKKSRTKKRPKAQARGKKSKKERKTESCTRKEVGKKKRKSSALNTASLDDFKIFTQSILQDLRVKREQMFAQMKEDMQKLVSVKSSTRRTTKPKGRKRTGQTRNVKSTESDMRAWKCSDGSLGEAIVSSRIPDSNNCFNALEERVNCDQTVASNKKEIGEHRRLLANQSMYACNQSNQLAASSYMKLPSAPLEKQLEQQNTESPFRNCVNPVVAGNGNSLGLSCDRRNLLIDAMNHSGYISGAQVQVPFPSSAQMGSKNISFNDQHCTQTSSMRNGFPLPFHQRLENSFNIPNQVENLSGGNNMLGWRMNGGTIRFSGNGHTLSDNIAANNVRNRMNYKANEEFTRYGIQDLRDINFN